MNYFDTLVSASRRWPEQTAIVDEFGSINFHTLWNETRRLQSALREAGVTKGSCIGVMAGNNRYFIMSLFATLACEAVAMPIANGLGQEEMTATIAGGRIHFVISDRKRLAGARPVDSFLFAPLTLVRTTCSLNESPLDVVKDAAIMRFTSGTTGKAKCVILSHRAIWERTEAANQGLRLTSSDKVLWVLPMAYHFVVSILLYVRYGVGIVVAGDFAAERILEKSNTCQATVLYGSPLHLRLLARTRSTSTFSTLRQVISTTTALPTDVYEAFTRRFGIPVLQALGIMEVGLPLLNEIETTRRPEAVGHPLPSFRVAILDDSGKLLPAGRTGRLAVQGPGMFDGYLDPPLPANAVLQDGMFVTGDLAIQTNDGLVEIKGRANAAIHISGTKVFPEEIENVLMQYPGVRQARAFGRPHDILGEVIAAEIEWDDHEPFDQEKALAFCGKHLSAHKIPHSVLPVAQIALTRSGKVIRH